MKIISANKKVLEIIQERKWNNNKIELTNKKKKRWVINKKKNLKIDHLNCKKKPQIININSHFNW